MSFKASNPAYALYEHLLKREVLASNSVEHIAIIQDGNRRYAMRRGISKVLGHNQGAETAERVSDWCLELGIKHLTLYSFSTENFNRDENEKRYLFDLIGRKFQELYDSAKIHNNQVRVRAIGRIDLLPPDLQEAISRVEDVTRSYSRLYLNVALAYGGQCELVDAARALARRVKDGKLKAADLNEDLVAQYLYPHDGVPVPKVDLIIRTGGEFRTSNFLPWQANGNECAAYFCAPYWPEFRKIDFLRAIRTAQARRPGQQA
ncbi:MAG TPA: polyprenyl diphosphate synthase [Methanotrichaceae archaeon]|nr:polyprenyl diphosphate synthase [Methanotrichaceae archaeon]